LSIPFAIIEGMNQMTFGRAFLTGLLALLLFSCRESNKPAVKDIVNEPKLREKRINQHLQELIEYASTNQGKINDTTVVVSVPLIRRIYEKNKHSPIWSDDGNLTPLSDSLYSFIENAKHFGLFPSDYNYRILTTVNKQLKSDSIARRDAALLSRTDVLLTDAVLQLSQHLKRGRLPYDSLTVRKDTVVIDENFYETVLNKIRQSRQVYNVLAELEPKLPGYVSLKQGLKEFIDTTEFRRYTYLIYPHTDSTHFYTLLKNRLYEENILDTFPSAADTAILRKAIAKYQAAKKLKVTGKINENTVNKLNYTAWEKFKRVALTLDKYKLMPDTMPGNYAWVNIPAYNLKVFEADSLILESKVIVGTPKTRTPELFSEISNFITYPQWTVPYSIIFKEMLPQIQKDTNYLKKQNLMVVDKNDSVIPPSKINWSKLSKKYFPYLIKQRQGDDNSLGVLKFNFRNKYAVYLHDTNARWLFSKSERALSHGCVRVQNWQELAHYLVRNDTVKYHTDTLADWIVRQEKHVVSGFKKLPLFIRYFTVEGEDGKLKFYEDIYAEDKILAEKYFSKNIY
jgi:murein L,D-transpeptidase YcbB/YkuD